MSTSTRRNITAVERALAERAEKARDIRSGEAKAHAISARKRRVATTPPRNSRVTRIAAFIEPEAREAHEPEPM